MFITIQSQKSNRDRRLQNVKISAFTLLEIIIAVAISAMIILGSYSLFNSIFSAQTNVTDSLITTKIYNGLTKIINSDFRNMLPATEELIAQIDNETDNSTENNDTSLSLNKENNNSLFNNETDKTTDNVTDNATKKQYIILREENNYPKITFLTYNSIFFNKAFPVRVTYYIDDDNYFVREERKKDVDFEKKLRLIGNIDKFEISTFNGEKFEEDKANPTLMRFLFTIKDRDYLITTGKIIRE
ncbi:MAG: prepilin-type N-terminal cleavage/methylation domain-containing protein [Deferribacterota bacterium]|nr:prepilin-type N-terminal cleavage/methylation domain-containing protein [Deferribacterota bacterium]